MRGARQRAAQAAGDGAGQAVEARAGEVVAGQILRDRQRRRFPGWRFTFEVVDVGEHLDGADAVGDRVAHVQQHRGPAVSSPSTKVTVHSGREMSSGDCSITSARSSTSRIVPGAGTRTRRTWKFRLKSGSTTQRGAAVGTVGVTTFWRSLSTRRDAFSKTF